MLDTIHRISKGTHRRHIRTMRSRTQQEPKTEFKDTASTSTTKSTKSLLEQNRNNHDTGTYTLKKDISPPVIDIEDVQVDGTKEYQNDIKNNWQQLIASNFFEHNEPSMEELISSPCLEYLHDDIDDDIQTKETKANLVLHRSKVVTKL